MTITNQDELEALKEIGKIVANALKVTSRALEPGITPRELDTIARHELERFGARSAPELVYDFPAASCISVNAAIAHGIPDDRPIRGGDLVNIDISAEKNGIFADNGASFAVPPVTDKIEQLCKDGRKALSIGLKKARSGRHLADIGKAINAFADKKGYTLIRNLASHGVGHSLHDSPDAIPTWVDRQEKRTIPNGLVMAIEPFLSLGGYWAQETGQDAWTLESFPTAPTVQYEHTVVATSKGALVVTVPD